MNDNDTHILLFDGVCNLCNGFVKFVIKRDRKAKFQFAALQSESAKEILKKFSLLTDDFESFVYISDGRCYLKSSAALHVAKDLGGFWRLFYIFIIIPKFMRDFLYSLIAKTRYKIFGKRDACMVPAPDMKQRFLP